MKAASAELEAQATALEHTLQYLNGQRKRCEELVYLHKCFIAPIASMPSDILLAIFDSCNLVSDSRDLPPLMKKAPLVLSSVCRRWRDLVINSPILWAKHGLTYWTYSRRDKPLLFLDLFLERAGSCSFPVELQLEGQPDNLAHKALGNSAPRWCKLDLEQCSKPDDRTQPLKTFGFPRIAPALEKLKFTVMSCASGDTYRFFQPFELCERLHDLRLHIWAHQEGVELRLILIGETHFPWRQLTTLHLNVEYPAVDVLAVLRACPLLEELRFETPDRLQDTWPTTRDVDLIPLMQLTKLTLPGANTLLLSVYCPAIEELELGSFKPKPIIAFFQTCQAPLRSLRVRFKTPLAEKITGASLYMLPFISSFPKLEKLDYFLQDFTSVQIFLSAKVSVMAANLGIRDFSLTVNTSVEDLCLRAGNSTCILSFVDALWRGPNAGLRSVSLMAKHDSPYRTRKFIRSTPLLKGLDVYRKEGLVVRVGMHFPKLHDGERCSAYVWYFLTPLLQAENDGGVHYY